VGLALGRGVGPRALADYVWLGTPDGEGLGMAPDGDVRGAPTGDGRDAGVGLGAPAVGEGEGVGATGGVAYFAGVAVGVAVGCVGAGVADGVAAWGAGEAGPMCLGPD
jgi:hypothetical protein